MQRKLFFPTTNGLKLCAIHEQNNSDTCIVLCHGIRGNKEETGNFTKLVSRLNDLKLDSFRFDFRGHGESEGQFVDMTISKEVEDLNSALAYLENKNYNKIILLGASFGAQSVALLDNENYENIDSIIFWYPALIIKNTDLFTNEQYAEAQKNGYCEIWNMSHTKVFKLGLELLNECLSLNPVENLKNNTLPKLFVHGKNDANVEIEANSITPSKTCPNSELVVINNAAHCFSRTDDAIVNIGIDETIKFIKSRLK